MTSGMGVDIWASKCDGYHNSICECDLRHGGQYCGRQIGGVSPVSQGKGRVPLQSGPVCECFLGSMCSVM